jgi:FixJ family two-component response regulator
MNNESGTVFLVDDDPNVRRSLSRMLSTSGYQVCCFESAELFLAEKNPLVPGCLLLDVCLPGLSGMELQRALTESARALPIVFLSGTSDIQTSVNAMKGGAVDFLTKPIEGERVIAAIDRAIQRDALHRRECDIREAIQRRFDTLTGREQQVMKEIIAGRLNKQIAADFGTCEKTVKVHRGRVMFKMGVRTVPDLLQLGARLGMAVAPALRRAVSAPQRRKIGRPKFEDDSRRFDAAVDAAATLQHHF